MDNNVKRQGSPDNIVYHFQCDAVNENGEEMPLELTRDDIEWLKGVDEYIKEKHHELL